MEIIPKEIIVRQTSPHIAYIFVSVFGLILDILALLCVILIMIGFIFIGITMFLPIFTFLVEFIGYSPDQKIAAFLQDLRDLNGSTIARIFVFVPPIMLVLFRDRIARPFRSWRVFAISLLICLPGLELIVLASGSANSIFELISNSRSLSVLSWLNSRIGTDYSSVAYATFTIVKLTIIFSGFLFFPYIVIFLIWYKRLGGFESTRFRRSAKQRSGFLLFLPIFLSNKNTWTGILYLVLSCAFGSLAIAVMPIEAPDFVLRGIVSVVNAFPLVSDTSANFFVGASAYLFWPLTVILIETLIYIFILRPRFVKFITLSMLLPVLSILIFSTPIVQNSDGWEFWLVISILLSIWIIPFVGFLHATFGALYRGAGLAQKAIIKTTLASLPSILMLRCFALDKTLVKRSIHLIGPFNIFNFFLIRLEEVIVQEAFFQAPVIAVANPHDYHEPLGAIREYFSDADWQPFVSDRIAESQAIIFVLGRGNYTGWETQKILENNALDRVIFVVPPDPQPALEYLEQNSEIRKMVGGDDGMRRIESGSVRGFIVGLEGTILIENHFKSELSYRLAMRRLLIEVLN